MDSEKIYLDCEECIQLFSKKEVYIFGAGIDAEQLTQQLSGSVNIVAYVDNNRNGNGNIFYGKEILNISQYLNRRNSTQPVIIASYRFAREICEQLNGLSLKPGIDYFVWDDMYLFHFDENTEKYIHFMSGVWRKYKRVNTAKKLLLPFDNRHDLMSVIYAYCGNYFAEKYNCTIYGYLRFGMSLSNASKVIEEIYKAFNVEGLIDPVLTVEQQKEADRICDSVWEGLETWEDWDRITIYGIHFGTTIIRHLLRVYIPEFDLKSKKMYSFLKQSVVTIVFWYYYIFENDIKVILLADGVTWDGYIRDIAIAKGIPTYAL